MTDDDDSNVYDITSGMPVPMQDTDDAEFRKFIDEDAGQAAFLLQRMTEAEDMDAFRVWKRRLKAEVRGW